MFQTTRFLLALLFLCGPLWAESVSGKVAIRKGVSFRGTGSLVCARQRRPFERHDRCRRTVSV